MFQLSSFNTAAPSIMHIDLNSCFATAEQQAHPHLRGRPVAVAAYKTSRGFILSNSIEAKRAGVKMLMRVYEAKKICPSLIVRTPDTALIRDIHLKFRRIFETYSDRVIPKSIDEAILDFSNIDTQELFGKDLAGIAREIKQRMRDEIGEWISCSVGISTNRFLAKTGASLTKPDGLEVITYKNVRSVFSRLSLIDIYGINVRYEARLKRWGIFTGLQFFEAPLDLLRKQVFKSILGYYWYRWFRGWEEGTLDTEVRKTYGQQYAIGKATADEAELGCILMKLCEKMGRRLRRAGFTARGIHVSAMFRDGTYWHMGRQTPHDLYTTLELYNAAQTIFKQRQKNEIVTKISVHCFNLSKDIRDQIGLFEMREDILKKRMRKVSDVLDVLNDKYGEFTVSSAKMMDMNDTVVDRIAFGNVREIERMLNGS